MSLRRTAKSFRHRSRLVKGAPRIDASASGAEARAAGDGPGGSVAASPAWETAMKTNSGGWYARQVAEQWAEI